MAINNDKTHLWKNDVNLSVDFYNDWFLKFAPLAYREARNSAIDDVESMLVMTQNLSRITVDVLKNNPQILSVLRMATAPPIARDRLIGLAKVPISLVHGLEEGRTAFRLAPAVLDFHLSSIISMIQRLLDVDIFSWLGNNTIPSDFERRRAASVVADRVCGAVADPIIRNEQEKRQLATIASFLQPLGYQYVQAKDIRDFREIPPGSYTYRYNIPVTIGAGSVNIPIDVIIMRKNAIRGSFPLLIECKSAGDFTNTNKRRKEEAIKMSQLRATYGMQIEFILFLCGYFDGGYLGYEAAEGIDWIWEHRVDDFRSLGI